MKFQVFEDADCVAKAGALAISADARAAITSRGRFVFAVSGGDALSQDRLFAPHAGMLYRTAFAHLRNKVDAADN